VELTSGRTAPRYALLCGALRRHLLNVGTVREHDRHGYIKYAPTWSRSAW